MNHKKINYEFKARCRNALRVLSFLENAGAVYKGLDHQIDTYFQVKFGRLKLREGNLENNLIWYDRSDSRDSKKSEVLLFKPGKDSVLKDILTASLGILVVVDKRRKIYFLENVKFHIDEVKDLGNFIEVEAQGYLGEEERLRYQCNYYKQQLSVRSEDIIGYSYSDLSLSMHDSMTKSSLDQ